MSERPAGIDPREGRKWGRANASGSGASHVVRDERHAAPRVQGVSLRIIVTGGAGFIGSHVAEAYVAAGHEVLVVDSLWEKGGGRRDHVPRGANFLHLDVRDPAIQRVFREFAPDVINHHAAQHSVAISARDPRLDADVNVMGLINVLDNAVKAGVRKVLFASSGATFGEPTVLPINESTPQLPESPYAITKMVAEHYLRFYKTQHGLDFTALRYGNVYGPRQDPSGEAGVIAIFIGRYLAQAPIKVFWDGWQTRDYIFVGDIAELNVAALEAGSGRAYCIGTNRRTSVNEIRAVLTEITGFDAPVEHLPKRPGDVRDAQIDPGLAERELGWTPKTSLFEGMKRTVAYFRERLPA
jgi:UDP-glucose 4-epimerase